MTENIEAIVLGYTKFGESSVVVHTLSEEYGRRGFLVHVGKKAGMALLLPMNILEMDVTPNPKSTLWRAQNLTAKDPLNGIRNNLYKNTMSLFLSEVLLRTVKDGQAEEGLYPWCVRRVLTLARIGTPCAKTFYGIWSITRNRPSTSSRWRCCGKCSAKRPGSRFPSVSSRIHRGRRGPRCAV